MAAADAVETGNSGGPLTLFRTDSTLTGGIGFSVSLGARIVEAIWVESSVRYHSARLSTRISGDIEGAEDVTAGESLQHIQLEAGAWWAA